MSATVSVSAPTETKLETAANSTTDTAASQAASQAANEADVREEVSSRSVPPPPLGVRFGEPLEDQRFRVAYSFDRIHRQGLLENDDHVSPSQVLNEPPHFYDRTPRSHDETIHTIQLAYAPHPRATLVIEVPFLLKELETMDASGRRTQDQTKGIGDIGFALILPFIRKGNESSHIHLGFDIPTGSIRRGGDETRLPYDLQIGNGTFDLEWGWTYRGKMEWLSWGWQVVGRYPIGENDLDYREGTRYEASGWGAVRLFAGISSSLRFGWQKQNNTHVPKRDLLTDPINDPSDNPHARGGTRLTVSPGLTFGLPQLGNQRIAIEVGIPVYQHLDGPQLKQSWSIKAGWQWGF